MTNYNEKCHKCGIEVTSGEEPIDRSSDEWKQWNDDWFKTVEEFKDHVCNEEIDCLTCDEGIDCLDCANGVPYYPEVGAVDVACPFSQSGCNPKRKE